MTHFQIVALRQGTAEWRAWRNKGVGASDAPAIMGENPWKREASLLTEKIVSKNYQNAAMLRGHQLEPIARKRYEQKMKQKVKPLCLQSNAYDWMRASVDGITMLYDRVVEIKCGKKAYEYSLSNQTVPEYYYGQLQHILAVTNLGYIDYWCYQPDMEPTYLKVNRNQAYIDRMIEAESKFIKKLWERQKEKASTIPYKKAPHQVKTPVGTVGPSVPSISQRQEKSWLNKLCGFFFSGD